MITIFLSMTEDFGKFFVLWGLLLFTFSTAGFFIFNELDSFQDLYSTFVVYFEASLGNWLLKIYANFS